jgi:hypothetical protein
MDINEFDVLVVNELLRKQNAERQNERPFLQLELPEIEYKINSRKENVDEPRRVIIIEL